MPAATNDRKTPPKQTWVDWLPPRAIPPLDTLLTREDVLDVLRERGVDVTEHDLRYWENEGILPRPVRQWFRGATRATYPGWYVELVERLKWLQRQGSPLRLIGPRLRAWIRVRFSDDPLDEEIRRHNPDIAESEATTIRLPWVLSRELTRLAWWHERLKGVPVDAITITITDSNGDELTYPLPCRLPESQ
jgi:hypothetical protein